MTTRRRCDLTRTNASLRAQHAMQSCSISLPGDHDTQGVRSYITVAIRTEFNNIVIVPRVQWLRILSTLNHAGDMTFHCTRHRRS